MSEEVASAGSLAELPQADHALAENTKPHPLEFTPVPRRYRHDGWTPERQRAFIATLAEWGNVTAAAETVGMTTEGVYHLRRQPGAESFRAAWEAALAMEGPPPYVPPMTMRGLMHALEAQQRRDWNDD